VRVTFKQMPRIAGRNRMWRCALALVILGLVVFGCRPMLRWSARPLIADESAPDAQFVWLGGSDSGVDGEDSCRQAAAWYHESAGRRILLTQPRSGRIVRVGILPSLETAARRELGQGENAVPAEDIVLLPGDARDAWDHARLIQAWLQDHEQAKVVLYCNRFHGGLLRMVLNNVLGPADAGRVAVHGVDDPRYDETNWWKSRTGVKAWLFGWLELAYSWKVGEGRVHPTQLSADEYQAMVAQEFGEAP
jgi:hypothetical protein